MIQATNIPYVKQYNETGEVSNPIEGKYKNDGSNRQNRKPFNQRAMSNKRGLSLVVNSAIVPDENGKPVVVSTKFKKVRQMIGNKAIYHSLMVR